jgi:hypothetical protein
VKNLPVARRRLKIRQLLPIEQDGSFKEGSAENLQKALKIFNALPILELHVSSRRGNPNANQS